MENIMNAVCVCDLNDESEICFVIHAAAAGVDVPQWVLFFICVVSHKVRTTRVAKLCGNPFTLACSRNHSLHFRTSLVCFK